MIFFIYVRTLHVCIFTIKLCHDFAINLSRKYREINCLAVSQWRSQYKTFLGGKSLDFKGAAVICKQINSFFSDDYFVI